MIGLVSLTAVDFLNQSAELHIMIGDTQDRGKGAGKYAVNTMLNHAFQNMNLQRIELSVLEGNEPAKRLYEKCGFVYEGRKRRARFKNGRFVDMLVYSILEVKKSNLQAKRFYQSNDFVFQRDNGESIYMHRIFTRMKGRAYEYQRKESNITSNGERRL